jgi:hypothetical protein
MNKESAEMVDRNRTIARRTGQHISPDIGGGSHEDILIIINYVIIIIIIKSRRMRLARNMVQMSEKRSVYNLLVGKPQERDH